MRLRFTILGLLLAAFWASAALAVPTNITVRVLSKDAKFVGTSMGGVLVTIRDVETGELLAKGTAHGTTGNTDLIIKSPRRRGVPISDERSSKFQATIDIDEPRLIQVTAWGPLSQRQAANRVSATQWVVPGKHISQGDAFLMELPGLVVDVTSPGHGKLKGTPHEVTIEANITMMCGCPLTPGGLWDAQTFEIKALLKRNGKPAGVLDMHYAGKPSMFVGTWRVNEPGTYEAIVYAHDPSNGNTGVDRVTFSVR